MSDECERFKNNPVYLEDHDVLYKENANNCWNNGYEESKADKPYNKDRASGCNEYSPDYRSRYKVGRMIDSIETGCELLIAGHKSYCPPHPDIEGCIEFLHNHNNKRPAATHGACVGMGDPRPNII